MSAGVRLVVSGGQPRQAKSFAIVAALRTSLMPSKADSSCSGGQAGQAWLASPPSDSLVEEVVQHVSLLLVIDLAKRLLLSPSDTLLWLEHRGLPCFGTSFAYFFFFLLRVSTFWLPDYLLRLFS